MTENIFIFTINMTETQKYFFYLFGSFVHLPQSEARLPRYQNSSPLHFFKTFFCCSKISHSSVYVVKQQFCSVNYFNLPLLKSYRVNKDELGRRWRRSEAFLRDTLTDGPSADTDVRYCPASECAITYVLITGIDGGASEICEGLRRAAHKDARGRRGTKEEQRPRAEVRLAGGLIKVV